MSKVFLITGFQNWGKTFLINKMFKRSKYYYKKLYPYHSVNFCVQPQSNDDLGKNKFESIINKRLSELKKIGIEPTHICTAFCPTKEDNNSSKEIIKNIFSNDEVYIIAIKYKWCLHAILEIEELKQYYSDLSNVRIHILSEKDISKKQNELSNLIKSLL